MRFHVVIVSKIFYLDAESRYTKYDTEFAIKFGVSCSIMMSKLVQLYNKYHLELVFHKTHGDRWFYATIDNVLFQTGLSRREQEGAIQKLKKLGLIELEVFGTPAKRFFRINEDKVNEHMGIKIELLSCPNVQNSNNKFKKQHETDENNPINDQKETTRLAETANWFGGNGSHGLINNTREHKRENIKEIHAPTELDACVPAFSSSENLPPKTKTPTYKPHENVVVTVEEHSKLVDKFGIELVVEGYADLSEWKESASPGVVAKHKSDYRRLRKWVIPNLQEEKMKCDRVKQQNIAPHRRGSKLVTQGDLEDPSNFKIKRF